MRYVNRFLDKRRNKKTAQRDGYSLADLNDIMAKLESPGGKSDLLEQVRLLKQALSILDKDDFRTISAFPELWGNLQLTLANNLSKLALTVGHPRQVTYYEEAIQHYHQALKVITPASNPEEWASTLNNLGNVYRPYVDVEGLIQKYKRDLSTTAIASVPDDWAMIHLHLGMIYLRTSQSEMALYHFDQALEVYTRPGHTVERALCELELASAYSHRTAGDFAENTDETISHYQHALQVFLQDTFPLQWIMIQRGLGAAYQQKISTNRRDNLLQAIHYYQIALGATNRETYPEQWGNLHFLLASAYQSIEENRFQNFEKSIVHFNLALESIDRENYPFQWAEIQFGLGVAYMDWRLDPQSLDIDKSISYLQQSFKGFPLPMNPALVALAHSYIGKAYAMRTQGNHTENLKQAIEHLNLGLKFFSPDGHPNEFRFWGKALVDVYLQTKEWALANTLMDRVLEADRILYRSALSQPSKWNVFESVSGDLYSCAGYIKARMQEFDKAIEIIDAGLSRVFKRGFGESVPYRDLPSSITIGEIAREMGEIPLVYLIHTSGGGAAIIIQPQGITPVWLDHPSTDTLHAFLSGKSGQAAYFQSPLARNASDGNTNRQAEWMDALDNTCRWLWDNVMEEVITTLEKTCKKGAQVVVVPCGLFSLLPVHAAWIEDPSMPAGRRFAQDHFTFGFAPSAVFLLNGKKLAESLQAKSLFVVENPAGDLKYSREAAAAAMALFDETLHLSGQTVDIATVKANFHKHTVMYFFTHGIVHPKQPFQSGILLADDQWLTLNDIFTELHTRNTRLVILAACETSLPANRHLLEETVSLPSVLLRAGIPGVIGTLWPVSEASTALLLTIFFELWRTNGILPQAALAEAQRILRDARYISANREHFDANRSVQYGRTLSDDTVRLFDWLLKLGDFHHPYYWAGFTYHGS